MAKKTIPRESIQRILILGSIGIGNLLLFSPSLRVIREFFPDAHIAIIVLKKAFAELYKSDPNIDEIIIADYSVHDTMMKKIRLIRELRNKKFDLCITTFPSNRLEYNLLPFIAGIKYRVAHRYQTKLLRTCFFLQNYRIPVDVALHDLEQNINLLLPMGLHEMAQKRLSIHIPDEDRESARYFLREKGLDDASLLIGIHAGSSAERDMYLKRWETDKFIELCRKIREAHGASLLIFGGPEEAGTKRKIEGGVGKGCVAVENVSLLTTAALIERCRLFISNDSGLMHIAVAVGVPCAAIFGPTDPGRTSPFGRQNRVIRQGLHCSPCWSIHNVGIGHINCIYPINRCLSELSAAHVYTEIRDMLRVMKKGMDGH